MVSFTFRNPRIETDIPVWLRLRENSTGKLHPGTLGASIVNISISGACLHIPKLLINGQHLFFSTLNSTHTLNLQPQDHNEHVTKFNIMAQSVWMDSFEHHTNLSFKVGVCFLTVEKKLFKTIKSMKK